MTDITRAKRKYVIPLTEKQIAILLESLSTADFESVISHDDRRDVTRALCDAAGLDFDEHCPW